MNAIFKMGMLFICVAFAVIADAGRADSAPPGGLPKKMIQIESPSPNHESSKGLPIVKIPENLSKSDREALDVISRASVSPVTKGIFPDYRPRGFGEDNNDISAWSAKDYQAICHIRDQSHELMQLTVEELLSMESKLGGINKHGMLTELKFRAEGVGDDRDQIALDGDNLDSFLAAVPPSWQGVINRAKTVSGSQPQFFKIAELEKAYGKPQTEEMIGKFSKLEQEKGRAHEIWILGLADTDWTDKIDVLKKKLKPYGYEVFAMEVEPHRSFFATKEQADAYGRKLNPAVGPVVTEEGPAELTIDRQANVVSTVGKVEKRELDPITKKRVEDLENIGKFFSQVGKFFGVRDFLSNAGSFVGVRFQFTNYPINWIPPQAKIEYLANRQIKISVPKRFAVSSKYREAFAIKNYNQYQYLVAQGLTAINYGMCGQDIIAHFRHWDNKYGLSVLQSHWDGVTVKLDKSPSDLSAFLKEQKQLCPGFGDPDLELFKQHRTLTYWWD